MMKDASFNMRGKPETIVRSCVTKATKNLQHEYNIRRKNEIIFNIQKFNFTQFPRKESWFGMTFVAFVMQERPPASILVVQNVKCQ